MALTALITGGGSGIGYAIAERLALGGYGVVIAGRDRQKLYMAAEELIKKGGDAYPIPCDVSKPDEVDALFESPPLKELNVLVNNAGVATFAPIDQTSLNDWKKNLDINLTGAFIITKKGIPLLTRSGGHIFNIVSVAGKKGFPNCGAYSASKFGLYGFTEVLREEMRARGVKVTAVLPGTTDTPIFDGAEADWDRSKMVRPEDIADSVLLALNQSETALMEEIIVAPASGAL